MKTRSIILPVMLGCLLFMLTACDGDGNGGGNLAVELLQLAYQSALEGDAAQALDYADQSLNVQRTADALQFKSQMQYVLNDRPAAYDTLSTFDEWYPENGEDDLIRATFLNDESGDCDRILANLETALNQGYGGLDEESYWSLVENGYTLAYFKESCPEQYAALTALKPPEDDALPTKCKQNYFKADVPFPYIGPVVWVDNEKTKLMFDVANVMAVVVAIVPCDPVGKAAFAAAVAARQIEVRHKNKGCGVKYHWTWANFLMPMGTGIPLFWMTSQN